MRHLRRSLPSGSEPRRGALIETAERLWSSGLWRLGVPLLPPAALAALVALWGVDLPIRDQWTLVPHLEALYQGELGLADLWRLEDGHRPLVPKIVMLVLARLSHWNIRLELILNVLLALALFLCLSRLLLGVERLGGWALTHRLGLLPLLSLLVFNLNQAEGWTWGWQLGVLLNLTAICGGLVLLLPVQTSPLRAVAAAGLGWITSYCCTGGLFYWLVTLPLVGRGDHGRGRRLALWLTNAAACGLAFLTPVRQAAGALLAAPGRLVSQTMTLLGAPLFPHQPGAARLAGVALTALSVYLFARLYGRSRHASHRRWTLAWGAVGGYAIGNAGWTALGRPHEAAMSGSDIAAAQLLLGAVLALALRWAENGGDPLLSRRAWTRPAFLAVFALLAWRSVLEIPAFRRQHDHRLAARTLLIDAAGAHLATLGPLGPTGSSAPQELRRHQEVLRRYRLSYLRHVESRQAAK